MRSVAVRAETGWPRRSGFTLVELMVVIAVIGILAAIVFRMMSATGEKNKIAKTVARLERVQNALSAYYAEYGSYPPVAQFDYPDPEKVRDSSNPDTILDVTFSSDTANRAAHSQSMAFEYPLDREWDDEIDKTFGGTPRSAVQALGSTDLRSLTTDGNWQNTQLFKFGLLSYLLPKAHIAWGAAHGKDDDAFQSLFKSRLWSKNDPDKGTVGGVEKLLETQMALEKQTVARWLPNFEKAICNGPEDEIMGVDLQMTDNWINKRDTNNDISGRFRPRRRDGTSFIVAFMTMVDGWDNEMFYYSAPPYQSYRVWSSGPDAKTFPPWIPMDSKDIFKQAAAWTEDDIVRFDR